MKPKKPSNLQFANYCRDFYKTVSSLDLNQDQMNEVSMMATAILMEIAVNYAEDPVDFRNVVMQNLDASVSMANVEQRSVYH